MKLLITKIELRDGRTLDKSWRHPMFVVNDKYLASSIDAHNIGKKKFDLQVGEKAEVEVEDGKKHKEWQWIIRRA